MIQIKLVVPKTLILQDQPNEMAMPDYKRNKIPTTKKSKMFLEKLLTSSLYCKNPLI